MAKSQRAKEPTVKEMQRLIYQVNKRMYRLEKSGASENNSMYENALAIIGRGEKKQGKKRLTVAKSETALKQQYMKALEITGSGNYEELTTEHIKKETERINRELRKQRLESDELTDDEIKRKKTFSDFYGIGDIDYATYNLLKSREFQMLGSTDSLHSDILLKTIAPAINVGLGTSQLRKMLREFMKDAEHGDGYYRDILERKVRDYVMKYGDDEQIQAYINEYGE